MNVYLKKILEKVDKTEKEDDKLLFCIAYPKYVREILEHISGMEIALEEAKKSGKKKTPRKKKTIEFLRNSSPKKTRKAVSKKRKAA